MAARTARPVAGDRGGAAPTPTAATSSSSRGGGGAGAGAGAGGATSSGAGGRGAASPTAGSAPAERAERAERSPASPPASPSAMASAAHLANASINLVALRESARKDLVRILDSVGGQMALVIDKQLSGPLSLVAEVELLSVHGAVEIFFLDEIKSDLTNVLFLVRPTIENMKMIAHHILHFKRTEPKVKRVYNVQFVPRRTILCERLLAEEGVFGEIRTTGEFALDLIPFDDDLLSLEMPTTYRELFLDGDPTKLYHVAKSLMKLQSVFGLIPNIKGKGTNADKVWKLMQRMRREQASSTTFNSTLPEIDTLILIDRQVDMITPLMTQLTYEGLIDEQYGIKNTMIDMEVEVPPPASPASGAPAKGAAAAPPPAAAPEMKKKKLLLNSNDSLFKEIRDLNFRVLGPLLHKKAEGVAETYDERHKAQTVSDMATFMAKFKTAHQDHNFLQNHINLADKISQVVKSKKFDHRLDVEFALLEGRDVDACDDYIEACIAKQEDLSQVLRLLCLMSQTNGVKPKRFDHLKREIVQAYGYEHMFTLNNLERLLLFQRLPKRLVWPAVRKGLRLCHERDKLDLQNPKDFYHTITGYCPLSIRIVEMAARPGGWKRADEMLQLLYGKHFEYTQELPTALAERARASGTATESKEVKAAAAGGATPKAESKAGTPSGAGGAGAAAAAAGGGAAGAAGAGGAPAKGAPAKTPAAGAGEGKTEAKTEGKEPLTPSGAGGGGAGGDAGTGSGGKQPLTLVYFLGGCTFAEISALRYLAAREGHGRDYLIATTKLVNGSTLIDSVSEHVQNNLKRSTIARP